VEAKLTEILRGRVTIVGVGNVMRGDDGFAAALCERIRGKVAAAVIDAGTAPENHIKEIRDSRPDTVLIVDAADFGGRPGDIRLLQRDDIPVYGISTHNLSPALFIDFLLSETKADLYMLAVQPAKSGTDSHLSIELEKTCESLAGFLGTALAPLIRDKK